MSVGDVDFTSLKKTLLALRSERLLTNSEKFAMIENMMVRCTVDLNLFNPEVLAQVMLLLHTEKERYRIEHEKDMEIR